MLLTALLAASAAASDLVIKRDGQKLTGKLKSCIGSRCQLGAQSIPRDDIAWIGLDTKSAFPPAVVDAYNDEVHLIDGSVESGALLTLNLGQIVTEKSNFKRADVGWIHFAPPTKNEGPVIDDSGGAEEAPPAPVPQPAPPTPKPSGPPAQPQPPSKKPPPAKTPPSQKPKPPGEAMKQCPADNPMGGLVVFDAQYNRGRDQCFETVHTVLRFPLVPFWHASKQLPWPAVVGLPFNESKIDYEISSTGCKGAKGDQECHEPAGRRAGTWVRTSLDTTLPIIHFSAVKPNLDAVSMPPEIAAAFQVPFDCQGRSGGSHTTTTVGFGGFSILDLSDYHCVHREMVGEQTKAFAFCAAPAGDCREPDSLPGSECAQHADRHATFPFSGEASWQSTNPNEELVSTKMRWDVCCGCAAKAAPPDATPRDQPPTNCVEEIASLRGKKKGLEDAADVDRKDVAKKTNDEELAYRKMFGTEGGLFKFSNATIGVVSKLGDSKTAQIAGLAAAVVAQQQSGSESGTDQALSNLAVAVEVGEGQIDAGVEAAYEEAIANYINEYLATGNEAAARAAFEEEFEHAVGGTEAAVPALKGVAAALALYDFYKASGEFAEQISEYVEAGDEVKEAGEDLEKTEEQINDLDVEIQTLLRNCPDAPPEESGSISPASDFRLASILIAAAPTADGHALKAKMDQLKAMNDKSQQRIRRSILPYLVPFMTGKWRTTDRRALMFLVRSMEPQLRALAADMQQEAALAQQVITLAKTVQSAGPPPSNAHFDRRDPLPSFRADRLRRADDHLLGR